MCRVQLQLLSVSELWPFVCVFMLFCIIYIFVHVRTHYLDDVSGTRMNVHLIVMPHCLSKRAYIALLAEL